MSRRSLLCDLNVLFTGNELQLVWKTREQFWDICGNDIFGRKKKNGIEYKVLETRVIANKQKKRENKRDLGSGGRGGDPGVS